MSPTWSRRSASFNSGIKPFNRRNPISQRSKTNKGNSVKDGKHWINRSVSNRRTISLESNFQPPWTNRTILCAQKVGREGTGRKGTGKRHRKDHPMSWDLPEFPLPTNVTESTRIPAPYQQGFLPKSTTRENAYRTVWVNVSRRKRAAQKQY